MICGKCGRENAAGKKFCVGCGTAVAASPQPPFAAPAATVPTAKRRPPPPPPSGRVFAFAFGSPRAAAAAPVAGPLPFQERTTAWAAQIVAMLGRQGIGGAIGRMVRAALMDKSIYAEVAADAKLKSESWIVLLASIALGGVGLFLASAALAITATAWNLGVQVVMALVRVWLVRYTLGNWQRRNLPYDSLFRALAYAQAPECLRAVPTIGELASMWTLVTTTVAIKDAGQVELGDAIMLALGAVVGVTVATYLLGMVARLV